MRKRKGGEELDVAGASIARARHLERLTICRLFWITAALRSLHSSTPRQKIATLWTTTLNVLAGGNNVRRGVYDAAQALEFLEQKATFPLRCRSL
jgi:hypothetical protein